jgi:hypothetical protein
MNVDQIKARLKSGEYILTEKGRTESEVWRLFCKISDVAVKDKIGSVHCLKCQSLLS